MTNPQLDCHQASHEEKCAAFANVYEFWGNDMPLEQYVQWRLNSIHHQRAIWYVGTVGNAVVASLGVFPMFLSDHGDVNPAMFIGAVHTHPDFRKRGYAAELISYVEQDQEAHYDVRWSFLFSDINPAYYARLGYQTSNAPNVCIRPAEVDGWSTEPLDITSEIDEMIAFYDTNHLGQTCFLHRPRSYWEFLVNKHAKDQFSWLIDSDQRRGYIHVRNNDGLACLEDFAVADYTEHTLGRLARSVASYANHKNISEVHGWFPPITTEDSWLQFSQRQTEITMWKSLSDRSLTTDQIQELAYFRHIDHV